MQFFSNVPEVQRHHLKKTTKTQVRKHKSVLPSTCTRLSTHHEEPENAPSNCLPASLRRDRGIGYARFPGTLQIES
jgi:hypothetical protein